jgi:hypothetical protein
LIITFDEHGGCYDHVPTPPPWTCSPDGIVIPYGQPGGTGFVFNRFGVRVPAVLVSPLIEAGTVCHTPFESHFSDQDSGKALAECRSPDRARQASKRRGRGPDAFVAAQRRARHHSESTTGI